jgi:hypothetical protein
MPDGIIYIARNNSNPENHYKIGKSSRIDPSYRMNELSSETTNYQDQFISLGHVIVSDVDECERAVHNSLSNKRINQRREFFNIEINEAIQAIRLILKDNILLDKFPNNPNRIITPLKNGNKEIYKSEKHILNYISKEELNNLNFHTLCKYADHHQWHWDLSCHGDYCCRQFRHAFYVMLNKISFISAYSSDPNFVPNLEEANINKNNITLDEKIRLQNLIEEINISKYLDEIKFPNNLAYIGVAMFIIGDEIESENRKITKFLIPEFNKLYPNQHNIIRELDDIYYNNRHLTCWSLSIFERMILQSRQNNH